jgi:HemY protein
MTLGRTIWFFVKIAVLVIVAVALADRPGRVSITWLGYNADLAVGTLLAGIVVLILILYVIWRIWHILRRAPTDFVLFRRNRRQARGFRALTRGLVAAAAGDAAEAKRLARTAHGLLDRSPLTLLLAAQAAQLEGDESAAGRYFEALAKNPEASLLGLRGLATAALKRGDEAAALQYSEKALQAYPNAEWAAETAHRLQVKLGRPAEESLRALMRTGSMSAKAGQRRRAVLLAEKARQALLAETAEPDIDAAIRNAREALKLDAHSVPARLILVHLLGRAGKRREAARLIEQAWDSGPHPLLGRAFAEAEPGERPNERMKRLERLARQNPDHAETHRAMAHTALSGGLWSEARRHLDRLLTAERAGDGVSQNTCRAMAALEDGERGDQAAARRWLDEAARALPDPAWICATCGHPGEAGPAAGNWQAVCPHCAAIDSYRWQRPVLPAGEAIAAPAAEGHNITRITGAETAVADAVRLETQPPAAARAPATGPAPGRPADVKPADIKPTGAKPAEPAPDAALAPSVDAARLIN